MPNSCLLAWRYPILHAHASGTPATAAHGARVLDSADALTWPAHSLLGAGEGALAWKDVRDGILGEGNLMYRTCRGTSSLLAIRLAGQCIRTLGRKGVRGRNTVAKVLTLNWIPLLPLAAFPTCWWLISWSWLNWQLHCLFTQESLFFIPTTRSMQILVLQFHSYLHSTPPKPKDFDLYGKIDSLSPVFLTLRYDAQVIASHGGVCDCLTILFGHQKSYDDCYGQVHFLCGSGLTFPNLVDKV